MGRLGGISAEGLFGGVEAWVDRKKAPGFSDQTSALSAATTAKNALQLKHFYQSPNLVWFAIAFAMHVVVPYDIAAAKSGFAASWCGARLALNFAVGAAYYGFWHVMLYWTADAGGASRKYEPNAWPTAGNMAHNLWYWSLGIAQWTFWECAVCRVWAVGLVGFSTDAAVLASPALLAKNIAWVFVVPLWRDAHFYIAHRFLHVRAMYKYIHSLHHRNADPEPFSGITMHPVEHLYYYSNAFLPTLVCDDLSPLVFLWIFIHLTLAPGAGHSGWEDHFQADQYHYLHHRRFECNYGSPNSAFLDQFFGTFREKLGESTEYSGAASEVDTPDAFVAKDDAAKAKVWSRAGYLGLCESKTHAVYSLLVTPALAVLAISVALAPPLAPADATAAALAVSVLPVAAGLLLCALSRDALSWRWPFHKETGAFALFNLLSGGACVFPVYLATRFVALA